MSRAVVLNHWTNSDRDFAPRTGLSTGVRVVFAWFAISVLTAVVGTAMTAGVPQARLERTVAQSMQASNPGAAFF